MNDVLLAFSEMEVTLQMRVVIWMNIPSHHQADFFQALRQAGVDLLVRYYDSELLIERSTQGWGQSDLQEGETFVKPDLSALNTIPDYKERIHIVPGYGAPFLRQLVTLFSRESVAWAHWSECSHQGMRWFLGYPLKRWYGGLVTRHALGAFAQGVLATNDFMRWGISIERIAFLHYAPKACDRSAEPARECLDFLAGRDAFLFLGTLCHKKAVDVLLKSFASIPGDERSRWTLLLVGKDYSQGQYRKMAHRFGLTDSVKFMEPIASNRISTVLKCAKVLILPSRLDGWGVVLNEAASMGLALIGSDKCGAAHHLIRPGINGFMVQSGSVDSLKAALQAYVRNPCLPGKHGEASLIVAEEFTPERNAKRFVAAIESWLSMRGPSGEIL